MPPWRDIAEFWPEPSVGPIKSNKYKWPNLRLEGAEYDCRAKGQMPSQNTLILHRSSFGAKKLSYMLGCSPCLGHPTLPRLDDLLRQGLW